MDSSPAAHIHGQTHANRPMAAERALPFRKTLLALALFCGITALLGGFGLCTARSGSPYLPPLHLLAHTPFADFLGPGLILALVVGGSSLACAWWLWRRSPLALDASILAGGALTLWILAQVAMLRSLQWLHVVYGALGATMLTLGVIRAWRSGMARQRWLICVTLGETLGFLAPTCVGFLSASQGMSAATQTAWLAAAGAIEGLALGAGQAAGFPFFVHIRRYALLTALGAGSVWLSVMAGMHLIARASVPLAVQLAVGTTLALVALAAIGSLQWLELRRRVRRSASRWIGWTALSWVLALPLSFTPSPFVDESTPFGSQLVLWGCAGMLMAYVMAQVTWQGVKRLK